MTSALGAIRTMRNRATVTRLGAAVAIASGLKSQLATPASLEAPRP
jgi:hypothetical protein